MNHAWGYESQAFPTRVVSEHHFPSLRCQIMPVSASDLEPFYKGLNESFTSLFGNSTQASISLTDLNEPNSTIDSHTATTWDNSHYDAAKEWHEQVKQGSIAVFDWANAKKHTIIKEAFPDNHEVPVKVKKAGYQQTRILATNLTAIHGSNLRAMSINPKAIPDYQDQHAQEVEDAKKEFEAAMKESLE